MSTLVELAGFTVWVVAAFVWQSVRLQVVTGLAVLGAVLLLVGYSLDALTVGAVVRPLLGWWLARAARRKQSKPEAAKSSR